MNMIRIMAITSAAMAVFAAIPAAAQYGNGRLAATEARQARQDARIDRGIANGRINPHEADRLDRQQTRIDRMQNRLAADGNFSRRDYARIDARQRAASHRIYRTRHNRR